MSCLSIMVPIILSKRLYIMAANGLTIMVMVFIQLKVRSLQRSGPVGRDGFANAYDFDLQGLKILNLNTPDYNILNWLAILTKYRSYWQKGSISEEANDYLQRYFFIDPTEYDVIIGYRADDSYFSFAQDFVAGTISLSKLSEAMHLGKLGEQIVLKSKESFSHIKYLESYPSLSGTYYEKKSIRDREARRAYRKTKRSPDGINELFMLDIMREGIQNGDPRLR